MNIPQFIVVFVMLWWVVFFMVLPFGVNRATNPDKGHDTGAPEKTYLRRKILITTLIALLLTGGADWLITSNYLTFLHIRPGY